MISYDEILDNMKTVYFENCGENPNLDADLIVRFKSVASEIFNLYVYADYVLKQSSWQSATGNSLDRIASECDLIRQTASRSTGVITFYIDYPVSYDINIPADVVCAKTGHKYIQYKTTEPVVILAGMCSASAPAIALNDGADYNAKIGEIGIMVNPPSGISRIDNQSEFVGGYDDEDDNHFRQRIADSLSYPANGINTQFIEDRIRRISDVNDCRLVRENQSVVCMVKVKSGVITPQLSKSIRDILGIFDFCGIDVQVRSWQE